MILLNLKLGFFSISIILVKNYSAVGHLLMPTTYCVLRYCQKQHNGMGQLQIKDTSPSPCMFWHPYHTVAIWTFTFHEKSGCV